MDNPTIKSVSIAESYCFQTYFQQETEVRRHSCTAFSQFIHYLVNLAQFIRQPQLEEEPLQPIYTEAQNIQPWKDTITNKKKKCSAEQMSG